MKLSMYLLIILFIPIAKATEFQDKPGEPVISTRRAFKISIEECKKTWEVSSEPELSYCAINIKTPKAMADNFAIVTADHFKFKCPVKDGSTTKQFPMEITPHGTFGYLVQAEGQVLFASVEQCLLDEIKLLPRQEVSVTFAELKAK